MVAVDVADHPGSEAAIAAADGSPAATAESAATVEETVKSPTQVASGQLSKKSTFKSSNDRKAHMSFSVVFFYLSFLISLIIPNLS